MITAVGSAALVLAGWTTVIDLSIASARADTWLLIYPSNSGIRTFAYRNQPPSISLADHSTPCGPLDELIVGTVCNISEAT